MFRSRALAIAVVLAAAASPAAAVTYFGAGAAIPDNSSSLSSITITEDFKIGDVNVTLQNINHNFAGDVQLYLTKGATSIALFKNQGWNSYMRGDLTFDDEAATPVNSFPVVGQSSYRPVLALSAFDGFDAAGTWTLKAADTSGGISGSYGGWSLQLTEQVVSAVPEPATWALMIMGFGLAGSALRKRRRPCGLAA